ncbi:hypothetical protein AGDE_01801 [Angomonas deanei]|nr:hypothetical protein AGDE_03242 [Angomonas deanei]EPY42122.1 hypothetical protein AGDE_01801 [Angomonas deanei]|eukprot:EPY40685.1 hypothetical protein AGDE_03242 [Angomonas deanei]
MTTVEQDAKFHVLPFKTDFEGETDVETNFYSAIKESPASSSGEHGGALESFFRGRPLLGRDVYLDPSYVIALASFHHVGQKGEEEAGGTPSPPLGTGPMCADCVRVTATADRFTVWEHDRAPENTEHIAQWIQLANDIHA